MFYVFSFPPGVYVAVGTLNLIASIPGPSILTLLVSIFKNCLPPDVSESLFRVAVIASAVFPRNLMFSSVRRLVTLSQAWW